ncbi:ommochrome-binding protein-like, partial [Amyelois transitella]|uniref:ommochrome-binding protein-like n=1 Tax=Amyelois transitella TaxID=680683 RepID=UPI002990453C
SNLSLYAKTIVCDGLVFNDVYFDKEVLFENINKPYNLVTHKFSGLIFFSHTIKNRTSIDFGIKVCHIKNKICNDVDGLPGGYAISYDASNDDMYLGGHDGIYVYNFLKKEATYFDEKGKSIWALFVRKNFYYIQYPSQKLYVYQNDAYVIVAEARNIEVDNFFIAKDDSVYYANKTALYKVEKNSRRIIVLDDDIIVRAIAEDSYGDIYFCGINGIYIEDKPYHRVKHIADIDQAYGLTFDENDRVIYSDATSIYRLQTSKSSIRDACYESITGKRPGISEIVTTPPLRHWNFRDGRQSGMY